MGNQEFSNWLFWDTDPNALDFRRHRSHVIQRVVSMGTLEDWKLLNRLYSSEEIIDASIKSKTLDKKTVNFLSIYFEIPKSEFKCFEKNQSTTKHGSY
ncbi:DUF6922 domain-containing protein [Marinoscillum sp.]|uniref:DUF6922 domain-containing protein n=1 Tax=Marinoscillum sp. TaxID=2024838 RepID=UPI003BABD195